MRNEIWLRLMSGLVLVGIFAAGTIFGAGLMRLTQNTPPGLPPRPPGGPMEAMRHELALDDAQAAELQSIMAAHRGELDTIMRGTQTRVRDVLTSIEEQLRPHLRPDQVQRLETWRAHRPPPPMPGMGPPPPGMGPPPPPPGL